MSDQSPYREDILSGKVAIVTGGGSGIGFEIAKQLGLHGATVTISGRRSNVLESACDTLRGLGIDAMFVQVSTLNNCFVFIQSFTATLCACRGTFESIQTVREWWKRHRLNAIESMFL